MKKSRNILEIIIAIIIFIIIGALIATIYKSSTSKDETITTEEVVTEEVEYDSNGTAKTAENFYSDDDECNIEY